MCIVAGCSRCSGRDTDVLFYERIRQLEGLVKGTTHLYTAEATLTDGKFVQFYSSLPNAGIRNAMYEFVAPKESSLLSKLTPFQEMMLTLSLVKLRLNPSIHTGFSMSLWCSLLCCFS